MKKTLTGAFAAVLVCFSSVLFAAEPQSFLNETTYSLFKDETVDNFAWGLDEAKGLVLGGYNSSTQYFNIGAGAWLGSNWYSLYDTGTFYAGISDYQKVTNDSVAEDGVNTDYTNVSTDKGKYRLNNNSINNELYFSFSNGNWGMQSYWKVSDTTGTGNPGKRTQSGENKAAGTSWTREDKDNIYNGTNTFGFNFNGVNTADPESGDLYFQLNNFEVKWDNSTNNNEYTLKNKQNGSVYRTEKGKTENYRNVFYPKVSGEMGFAFSDLGSLSTRFVLEEEFDCSFTIGKNQTVTTTVNDNFNTKTTTKVTEKNGVANPFYWNNTLTPKFLFDFDVGERLNVKAKVAAGIGVYNLPFGASRTNTKITETNTYNKLDKTTTKSYRKEVSLPTSGGALIRTQTTDSVIAYVFPITSLALEYQVKPGKFNLSMGVEWDPGSFFWQFNTTKNKTLKESVYEESTNEAGTKTVIEDSVNYYRGDGPGTNDATEESKETVFYAYSANTPTLKLGASWFITEKAALDIAYTGGFTALRVFNGGNGGLLGSELKLMFSVKF